MILKAGLTITYSFEFPRFLLKIYAIGEVSIKIIFIYQAFYPRVKNFEFNKLKSLLSFVHQIIFIAHFILIFLNKQ